MTSLAREQKANGPQPLRAGTRFPERRKAYVTPHRVLDPRVSSPWRSVLLPDLHLVLEGGNWMLPGAEPESLLRLATYLAAHGSIILTLVSWDSLSLGEGRVPDSLGVPDHVITEGGLALHHAQPGGAWQEDAAYGAWVSARWDPLALERVVASSRILGLRQGLGTCSPRRAVFQVDRPADLPRALGELESCLGRMPFPCRILQTGTTLEVLPRTVDAGEAARFLHAHLPVSCPLMACGASQRFVSLLGRADYPVLLADTSMAQGLSATETYLSPEQGPRGVLDALFRYEFLSQHAGKENCV